MLIKISQPLCLHSFCMWELLILYLDFIICCFTEFFHFFEFILLFIFCDIPGILLYYHLQIEWALLVYQSFKKILIYFCCAVLGCGFELLVSACRLLVTACIWDLVPQPRIKTRALCIGNMEAYSLDHQGSPCLSVLKPLIFFACVVALANTSSMIIEGIFILF